MIFGNVRLQTLLITKLLLVILILSTNAKADLSCPASNLDEASSITDNLNSLDVRTGTCAPFAVNLTVYNNAGNGGFATASFPFTAFLPDSNPVLAAARFVMHNGTAEVVFSSVTCAGATVSSLGAVFVDITLANDTSCELTIGGDSDTIGYSGATLTRTGAVYSLSAGTLRGGAFGGTFSSAKAEPTNHPTNFAATTNSTSQITTTWTDATGAVTPDSYLVLCSTSNSFTNPVDATAQTDDTSCVDGTGIQNISQGAQTIAWTGLNAGTQYFYKIFPFTNTSSDVDYKTDDTPLMANATTTASINSDATLSAGIGITEPIDLPTTADTTGEAVNLFDFTITDGGGGDGLSTDVSQIVLNTSGSGDFSKVTWRLNGNDTTNITGTYNSSANTITFSSLNISVADGGNETYTLNGFFNDTSSISDNSSYIFSVDGDTDLSLDAAKTQMAATTAVTNGTTGTKATVTATKLIYTTAPAGSVSGIALSTQPSISAVDASNNVDTDYISTITLTEASAGALSGTSSKAATAGVASFTGLIYTATADNQSFTLTTNDSSLTNATASTISSNIVATKLVFSTQPSPTSLQTGVNTTFSTVPVVQAQDANNAIDTDFIEVVTLSENGGGTGTFTNNTATASNGVATFTGLTLSHNTAETLQLVANDVNGNDTDLPTVNSSNIVVTANQVPVTTLPSSPAIAEDSSNNTIADISIADADSDNQTVTLTMTNSTASLSGTTGLSITTGDGTNDSSMVFSGTLSDINTALNNLTVTPTSDFSGTATLQIQTDDGNSGTDDDTLNITVNNAPEVSSINRTDSNPSNAASIDFTVTFSESVSNIDTGDFTLVKTSSADGTIASVSAASGSSVTVTVTVTVNSVSGDGTLGLNLVDNDSITNGNSVALGGVGTSSSGDGSFTGQIYTIDKTAPTVTVNIVDTSLSDSDNSSNVTFEFSESTSDFAVDDVSVVGGAISSFTSIDSDSYTATFTATDNSTTQGSVTVNASSYSDAAGNNGVTNNDTVTVDTANPTLSSLSPADDATGIAIDSNLVITLSENAVKGTGNILIKKTSGDLIVETIDVPADK